MVKRTLIGITLLGSALAMANEAPAQTVMGAGMLSCGEWLRLRSFEGSDGQHSREVASDYQMHAWVDGFISGVNLHLDPASPKGPDMLASQPSSSAIYAVIDNYCRANPLEPVVAGVLVLIKELRARATAR